MQTVSLMPYKARLILEKHYPVHTPEESNRVGFGPEGWGCPEEFRMATRGLAWVPGQIMSHALTSYRAAKVTSDPLSLDSSGNERVVLSLHPLGITGRPWELMVCPQCLP